MYVSPINDINTIFICLSKREKGREGEREISYFKEQPAGLRSESLVSKSSDIADNSRLVRDSEDRIGVLSDPLSRGEVSLPLR